MVDKQDLMNELSSLVHFVDENITTLNSIGKGTKARDWAIVRTKLQEAIAWANTYCQDVREAAGAE